MLHSQSAKPIGHLIPVHVIMSLEGYNSKRASFIAACPCFPRGSAHLIRASLHRAHLVRTSFHQAEFSQTDFSSAKFPKTDLRAMDFTRANFIGADLREAELSNAILNQANLSGANLGGAALSCAAIHQADLSFADLRGADLLETDLRGSNLSCADLRGAVLIDTRLQEVTLDRCNVYGISAWNLRLEGAKQSNLLITNSLADEPVITVDNLEVAQLIYLLLNNAKVRDVINTITTKIILILGRFTPERKALLIELSRGI